MADVVVIGAGIAGLVAVYHILKEKPDAKVTLLEAAEHAGGQIRSLQLQGASGADTWDIGASFIQRSQKCLMSLLSEFKLETLPPSKGKRILQLGDGTIKSYSGSIPPLPWSSLLDLHRYMSKLEGSSKKINMTNPCEGAKAVEQDNTSVEELKVKTLWTQSAKDMADTLAGSVLSVNPKNISVLYYEYMLHANKGWEGLLGSSKDGLHRIKGGAGKLVSALVEAIGETNIVFNSKVMSIKHTHEGGEGLVTVEVMTGETYTAKKVIVTQGRDMIEFLPSAPVFPPLLPITYGISFVMTFSKSFWQDNGYCGEVLSMSGTIQYLTGDGDWFATAIFDATTVDNPALSGILNPLSLRDKTVEERKSEILKLLAKYFKMENVEVLDYADHTWGEPWKYGDKLLTASSLADRRKPFHSIHWADRHTAMEWYNTIEGAVQVGLRAAKEVLNCI
ncbi:putative flavin-containing monoamine oxidase AofH [Anneissia japonica]|uniref:putative flavin-containing monoamine oxidase AofH n=1 Tax=Anneissia japonica TaxID=1529436 RepID=UPI0014258498|nr:putative flavin-containing monoamine oxidase AofH [Anneissia japonica]